MATVELVTVTEAEVVLVAGRQTAGAQNLFARNRRKRDPRMI
jgi:hypothetical protein